LLSGVAEIHPQPIDRVEMLDSLRVNENGSQVIQTSIGRRWHRHSIHRSGLDDAAW
jgi:hypothetical protein